jgi:large subunit ribosomal protein L25
MDIPTVKAETRKAAGSRAAERLRRSGKLPGIVYGHKQDPVPVVLDRHTLQMHLDHGAHLLQLDMGGKSQPCLVKDAQYDHLGATLVHLDLARVDLSERVKVHVPIELRGIPKGIAEGGVLNPGLSDLEIECVVASIPEKIRVDVSHLALNTVMYVKDLKLAGGVTAVTDGESVVATVKPPHVAVEAVPGAAPVAGATEPEVIAKGKIEVEGEEGPAAAKPEKAEKEKK